VLKWSRKINKFVCGSEEELIAIIISQQLPEQRRSRTNGMSPSSLLYYLSLLSSFSACKSSSGAHSFFLAAPENKQELSTEVALLCHGREIYIWTHGEKNGEEREKQPIMMLSQCTQDRNKICCTARSIKLDFMWRAPKCILDEEQMDEKKVYGPAQNPASPILNKCAASFAHIGKKRESFPADINHCGRISEFWQRQSTFDRIRPFDGVEKF
jgi:hypothetical protein